MKKSSLFLTGLFLLMLVTIALMTEAPGPASAQDDPYKIIATQADLDSIVAQVRGLLLANFSITFKLPVRSALVSAAKLDELYKGAYRGAEIGLYHFAGNCHDIFIMTDMSRDSVTGTVAHEMTHAWQTDFCPADQDLVLKEGFANWIAYKIMQKIGAFTYAQNILEHADPVYGVGFKKMLEWEDALGERGLVEKVKKARSLAE